MTFKLDLDPDTTLVLSLILYGFPEGWLYFVTRFIINLKKWFKHFYLLNKKIIFDFNEKMYINFGGNYNNLPMFSNLHATPHRELQEKFSFFLRAVIFRKKLIPEWTNSRITTSLWPKSKSKMAARFLKERFRSHQKSLALIGCCKIIYRAFSVVNFFFLVWMCRLAAGIGVGVRSMPTGSFGWGGLMLQDPPH